VGVYVQFTANSGSPLVSQNPAQAPTVNSNTIIDMTLKLNTFSSNSSWAWMNGNLLYWSQTIDTQGFKSIRIKFKPVPTPTLNYTSIVGPQCCTCDMPSNCNVINSSGGALGANFFIQTSGSNAMNGAVFATQYAAMGGMGVSSSPGSAYKTLSYRLSGAHYAPDGSLTQGSLIAMLPLTTIQGLYPFVTSLTTASSALNLTRSSSGDSGTTGSVSTSMWTSADYGVDAIAISVSGISFSAPVYDLVCNLPQCKSSSGVSLLSSLNWLYTVMALLITLVLM
jgi:hypothetical protein